MGAPTPEAQRFLNQLPATQGHIDDLLSSPQASSWDVTDYHYGRMLRVWAAVPDGEGGRIADLERWVDPQPPTQEVKTHYSMKWLDTGPRISWETGAAQPEDINFTVWGDQLLVPRSRRRFAAALALATLLPVAEPIPVDWSRPSRPKHPLGRLVWAYMRRVEEVIGRAGPYWRG